MSSACVPLEDLSALLDGELGAADAARVREHAASCATCGAALAQLSAASRLVRALPREHAGDALAARVAARASARRRRLSPRAWTGLAAAAALLAFGVLFFPVRRSVMEAPELAVSPSRSRALPASPRDQAPRERKLRQEQRDERLNEGPPKAEALPAPDPAHVQAAPGARLDVESDADGSYAEDAPTTSKDDVALPAEPRPSVTAGALGGVAPGAPPRGEQELEVGGAREVAGETHVESVTQRSDGKELADALSAQRAAPAPAAQASERRAATLSAGGAASAALAAPPVECGRVRDVPESRPVEPGPGVEPPVMLTRSALRLPRGQGPVAVRAIVELDGTTSACEVAGARSEEVARSAKEAASRFTWRPARVAGRPHAAWVTLTFPE